MRERMRAPWPAVCLLAACLAAWGILLPALAVRQGMALAGAFAAAAPSALPQTLHGALGADPAAALAAGQAALRDAGYGGLFGRLFLRPLAPAAGLLAAAFAAAGVWLAAALRRRRRQRAAAMQAFLDWCARPQGRPFAPAPGIPPALIEAVAALHERLAAAQQLHRQDDARTLQYLEGVCHQLKTPLSVLQLTCEQAAAWPQAAPAMQVCLAQVQRMTDLIRELLQLGRFACGRAALHFANVRAAGLLTGVVDTLDGLALQKGLQLRLDLPADTVWCCDGAWMQQALENLVKNCIEHSSRGEIVLCCRQTALENRITVTDEGEGFAPGQAQRAFERYTFGSRGQGEGAGLGLAIVRQVALCHFGTVQAENRPGGGACFTLTFPRLDADTLYARAAAAPPEAAIKAKEADS